jgi:hypothetical protein
VRRRWRIRKSWQEPLSYAYLLGWIPACIAGQFATGGSLGYRATAHWGFFAALAAWFGPPLLIGVAMVGRYLWLSGLPVERVSEPVTTDLRETK